MSLNRVALTGRITHDLELRKTNSGTSVTTFTVAVDNGKDQPASFIDCLAWQKTAEMLCQYWHKGKMIAVDGRIQTRNFEDKQGNKRKATEVVADRVYFCGDKDNTQGAYNGTASGFGGKAGVPVEVGGMEMGEIDYDGELPF